jgi:hypothetical protein
VQVQITSSATRTDDWEGKKSWGLEKDLVWDEGGSFVQCAGRAVTAGFGIWRATDLGRSSQWEAFRGTSSRVRGDSVISHLTP